MKNSDRQRPLALVTGASSGIGVDLARELAAQGHDLVLVARRAAPMQELASELRELGAHVRVIAADLTRVGAATRLFDDVTSAEARPVEVLINNAGVGQSAAFADSEPARLAEMIQLNVIALTELTRAFLPAMLESRRGRILLVASMAGHLPGPFAAVYHATKAYVLSLGEALAYELGGTGVTATTLCPGPTHTGYAGTAGAATAKVFSDSVMTPVMSSLEVARIGLRALEAGRPMVVAGVRNKLSVASIPFMPRALLLHLSANLNRVPEAAAGSADSPPA